MHNDQHYMNNNNNIIYNIDRKNEIAVNVAMTINNPTTNVRSTIDTSKNTQHKASNNGYSVAGKPTSSLTNK